MGWAFAGRRGVCKVRRVYIDGWSAGEVRHTDRQTASHHITYSPRISLAEHSTVVSIHPPCSPTRASFENKSHKPHHRFTNQPTNQPTRHNTHHNARRRKVIPPRLRRLPRYVPFLSPSLPSSLSRTSPPVVNRNTDPGLTPSQPLQEHTPSSSLPKKVPPWTAHAPAGRTSMPVPATSCLVVSRARWGDTRRKFKYG
jgi:hypothetical protein